MDLFEEFKKTDGKENFEFLCLLVKAFVRSLRMQISNDT